MLLAQVVLTAAVSVGCHVAIMPHVTLTHDDVIEDFATIAAGARLAASTSAGLPTSVPGLSCARDATEVGACALVGMGAVVTRDVPACEVWAGVPARRLRASDAPGARA